MVSVRHVYHAMRRTTGVAVLLFTLLAAPALGRSLQRQQTGRAEAGLLQSGLQRHVNFRHGTLITSRAGPAGKGESQISSMGAEAASVQDATPTAPLLQVWALGLDPHDQANVLHTLQAQGGSVLRVLPGTASVGDGYHWLVKATESAIAELLAQHQHVTAAVLPDEMKVSESVTAAVRSTAVGESVTLLVFLPHASAEELAAATQIARQELPDVVGLTCKLAAAELSRMHAISITVCSQSAQAAAGWAASQPGVTWVSVQPRMQLSNLYASATIQDYTMLAQGILDSSGVVPLPVLAGATSGYLPFWQQGLTGKDQVVGVFDTGIDTDSCFFFDPKVPNLAKGGTVDQVDVSMDSTRITATVTTNYKHRKVVQLTAVSDAVDSNGHGTHVAGTLAGSASGFDPLTEPLLATGVAPDAKLAFVDVSKDKTASSMDTWGFSNVHQLYEIVRTAGARVTSTSIVYNNFNDKGAATTYPWVDEYCYLWDEYTWQTPDMVHVCSAGNTGQSTGYEYVTAPSICKNTVAVAAADGWWLLQNRSIDFELLTQNGDFQLPRSWRHWHTPGFSRDNTYLAFDSIMAFSSFKSGLTFSGSTDPDPYPRIKPDVAAPGLLLSAWTDKKITGEMDKCSVRMDQGTSMATPVVSGAAAIVRQYFQEGYYPTGAPTDSDSLDPSGTLVKAVLIAGTAAMQGYSLVNMKKLDPPPSPFQGFGRINLLASLPLASDPTWNMWIQEDEFKSTNEKPHQYTISTGDNSAQLPLVVVLTWYDWPAAENTGGLLLVNDLDLVVQDSNGKTYPVNGKKGRDSANTVEKVYIENAPSNQDVSISVKVAKPLFVQALPQSYSVVVLGPLSTS